MQNATLRVIAAEATRRARTARNAEAVLADITLDLIASCVNLGNHLRSWQEQESDNRFSGKRFRVEETGRDLNEWYSRTLEMFDETASRIKDCRRRGYRIKGAKEFRLLHEQLKLLAEDFDRRWPRFDSTEIQQGIERGKFLTAEEFRDALLRDD